MITPDNTQIASLGPCKHKSPLASARAADELHFVSDEARVRYAVEATTTSGPATEILFEKAGPRDRLFFKPRQARAAIVTCGGICPGLNNVIRSAVLELRHRYGVKSVLGIRYGYAGLNPRVGEPPIELTCELVSDIHEEGGTILGSSRGPQPVSVMVDFLIKKKVDILLCVGGDGTLRGARDIANEAQRRGLKMAVVGIPKTIDNDVMYVARTFGVITAVEKAREVLDCAHNEATSAFHGVGLVKVMGRDAGFIAAAATLASQEVNFCFIPELPFKLEGSNGFLRALRRRLEERRHAVVIVAEGAGQDLLENGPGGVDASGNKRYGDIGLFIRDQIKAFGKRTRFPIDVKYFDPSYFIRSVPANCDDALLCDQLARHAVHAAMAGKTNLIVGNWNDRFTHLPISLAVSRKKQVDLGSLLWSSVLAATGQPRHFK